MHRISVRFYEMDDIITFKNSFLISFIYQRQLCHNYLQYFGLISIRFLNTRPPPPTTSISVNIFVCAPRVLLLE